MLYKWWKNHFFVKISHHFLNFIKFDLPDELWNGSGGIISFIFCIVYYEMQVAICCGQFTDTKHIILQVIVNIVSTTVLFVTYTVMWTWISFFSVAQHCLCCRMDLGRYLITFKHVVDATSMLFQDFGFIETTSIMA